MASVDIPVVFSAPRSIRRLNVVAVAASLAACTSAGCMLFDGSSTWALLAGIPTFFVAWLWAVLLRWPAATARLKLRWGWIASVPLAMLNGGLAGGAFVASAGRGTLESFVGGGLVGATFGVVFWAPALLLVLVLFGLPIARAQQLAKRGLAGEEKGEALIGATSAALGVAALVLAYTTQLRAQAHAAATWADYAPYGAALLHVLAAVAVACGALAAVRALAREARRRRFVARVEASEEPGYRVEPTRAGKVLLRVAPVATYRIADCAEELFELDESGRATHRPDASALPR